MWNSRRCGIPKCLTVVNEYVQAAKDLDLESKKAIKLEFSTQLGYFFRITKKVMLCFPTCLTGLKSSKVPTHPHTPLYILSKYLIVHPEQIVLLAADTVYLVH